MEKEQLGTNKILGSASLQKKKRSESDIKKLSLYRIQGSTRIMNNTKVFNVPFDGSLSSIFAYENFAIHGKIEDWKAPQKILHR